MRFRIGFVAVAAVVASVGWVVPASADPAAEQLFREGRDLLQAGKIPEACDRFARSQAIEPRVGTLLNLGDCRERQGLYAAAWEAFAAAQAMAAAAHDDRATEAARRAEALAPRLAHLTVTLAGPRPDGLALTRNGQPLAVAALDTELPVDPGHYDLVAAAPGHLAAVASADLAVGAHQTVAIPAPALDPAAPRPGPVDALPASYRVRPPLGHLAPGIAFGGTSDSDLVGGLRLVTGYPVPYGAVRATAYGLYTRYRPDDDIYHHVDLYAIGIGFDYLLGWGRGLASAAGLGFGLDLSDDNYQSSITSSSWFALRASPLVVRIGSPRLEVGVHLTFVLPAKVMVGVLAVDWFVW